MRLLYVVQRYGPHIPGGDAVFSREFATRLARRGHEIAVLTSCAESYMDWANVFEPGTSADEGVTVHRLPVVRSRNHELFNELNGRVLAGTRRSPLYLQLEWMRMQGPEIPELRGWLEHNVTEYDAAVFFTYNYYTTWAGLPAASGLVPTVFHPTAHDEPPFWLPIYDFVFRLPHAFGFLIEEEAELVRRRFRVERHSVITGIGVAFDGEADEEGFRVDYGLDDKPYILYVGRIDPHKGVDELYDFFVTYKTRNPGPLKLVLMGDPIKPPAPHPDVVVTGFARGDAMKHSAIEGATAIVMPSFFESFSISLVEGWARRKPALVQGRCDVLVGQATRSGGAIPYVGYAEFETGLDMLLEDAGLRRRLGAAGRSHAEERYRWDHVLDRYERFLDLAVTR